MKYFSLLLFAALLNGCALTPNTITNIPQGQKVSPGNSIVFFSVRIDPSYRNIRAISLVDATGAPVARVLMTKANATDVDDNGHLYVLELPVGEYKLDELTLKASANGQLRIDRKFINDADTLNYLGHLDVTADKSDQHTSHKIRVRPTFSDRFKTDSRTLKAEYPQLIADFNGVFGSKKESLMSKAKSK
jgi:hypothetical protein